jgi:FkbM family methyltransferase
LIRPGDTVLDVGANIGLWSMSAAIRAGGTGRLHAFEPFGPNRRRLAENLALNAIDNVQIEDAALADFQGSASFFAPNEGDSGKGRLVERDGLQRGDDVEVTTIDRFCQRAGIEQLHFVKVDVEGAEEAVFRGGREMLQRDDAPAVLFESAHAHAAAFGSSCGAVKRLLHECGYDVYLHRGPTLDRIDVTVEHEQDDLFAFKDAHFARHPMLRHLLRQTDARAG